MNIFECNISFYVNRIEIVFSVVNGKTFSYHVPEKFLKSDKPFKSYDHISLYMSVLRNSVQYLKSACIVFLYSLDCPLITLLILERITSIFQLCWSKKELPVT